MTTQQGAHLLYGSSFPPPSYGAPLGPRENQRPPKARPNPRTTKVTQKLVLFPEDNVKDEGLLDEIPTVQQTRQPGIDALNVYVPDMLPDSRMTEAERLSKDQRNEFPRVSSYCVAEGFKLEAISRFVRDTHSTYQKTYDECLYVYYEDAAKKVLFGDLHVPRLGKPLRFMGMTPSTSQANLAADATSFATDPPPPMSRASSLESTTGPMIGHHLLHPQLSAVMDPLPSWMLRGEVFVFDYGVVVLWNFAKDEEERIVHFLKRFAVSPVPEEDMELEDLHYQYDILSTNRPRMYSDMITLKSSSPLVKLTISHALAQSCKLSIFENVMDESIEATFKLPKMMAKYGTVKMQRIEIMKIVGHLFRLKMNVNLISNVLDTPEIFDSEPQLKGLYNAIRGYMEITQRALVLNTRADVVSDLLEMLSDHLNSNEMHYITWIVIALICMAVIIAIGEVYVKYLRLLAGME